MALSTDLDEASVGEALPGRPVRVYAALLSTEAAATAWAREGAASGSVVAADYQASPRGRAGLPWRVRVGQGLGFSLVLHPRLTPEREGWPYISTLLGISDALGGAGTRLHWPDQVRSPDGTPMAAMGLTVQLGPGGAEWVVATVLVDQASPPRPPLLAAVVQAVETRADQRPEQVLDDYRLRCTTLGQRLRALLVPVGPAGPQVSGTAVDVLADGALVLLTERNHRVAVRPQSLGLLEPSEGGGRGRPTSI